MTADDLRALATAAHLHDRSYVVLVDWLVNHADALADLIDAARAVRAWEDETTYDADRALAVWDTLDAALAALEADRGE